MKIEDIEKAEQYKKSLQFWETYLSNAKKMTEIRIQGKTITQKGTVKAVRALIIHQCKKNIKKVKKEISSL